MTEVLRSRRSTAVALTEPNAAALEVRMKHAAAIAAAKSAIPTAYQNNPGAVMLAQEWAAARGVDLLTTIQTVAFIGGKPVVDATMQRALAMRAGYEVDVTVDDEAATCTLSKDGKACGSSTYTLKDAETAGLTGKENWKKNPKAMLVARATAQTMRWHAADVMVGVFTEDELDDPIDTLEPTAEATVDTADVVEAEVVEALTDDTWDRLVAAGADLTDGQRSDLEAWLKSKGWSLKRGDLSEATALEVVAWIERRG